MFIKHFFFEFILLFIGEIESFFSFVAGFLSFTQMILIQQRIIAIHNRFTHFRFCNFLSFWTKFSCLFKLSKFISLHNFLLIVLTQYFCSFLNVHGTSCFTVNIHWFLEVDEHSFGVKRSKLSSFFTGSFLVWIQSSVVSIGDAIVSDTCFTVIKFQILVSMWALNCNVLIESTINFLSGFVWFDTSKLASYYLLLFLFQIFLSQISIIFNITTSLWF